MIEIETILVDSSAIHNARYSKEEKSLYIQFRNKSSDVYRYNRVPLFYWRGLQNSNSKGEFINEFILKRFSFNKIT